MTRYIVCACCAGEGRIPADKAAQQRYKRLITRARELGIYLESGAVILEANPSHWFVSRANAERLTGIKIKTWANNAHIFGPRVYKKGRRVFYSLWEIAEWLIGDNPF